MKKLFLLILFIFMLSGCETAVYEIGFNSLGGSSVDQQIIEENNKLLEPADPTKEGFDFLYWYLDDENTPFDFESEIQSNFTLNAKWEVVTPTYLYSYVIEMKNYEDYLSYDYKLVSQSYNDKKIEVTVHLLEPDAKLEEVTLSFKIRLDSNITNDILIDYHDETITTDDDYTFLIDYSMFSDFTNIELIDITGTIFTNTSHELDWEQSNLVKSELETSLLSFANSSEFTIKTFVSVNSNGYTSNSDTSSISYRETPFYLSNITADTGILIYENEGIFNMLEIGVYDNLKYYRTIDQQQTLPSDFDISNEVIQTEDNFYYTFVDGVYYLSVDAQTFLEDTYEQDLADQLISLITNDDIEVSIQIVDQVIVLKTKLTTTNGYVEVTTRYIYEPIRELNKNYYEAMPPNHPAYINDVTDVSEVVSNQLYVSGTTNYYAVELESSLYAFDYEDFFYDYRFFDTLGNEVVFERTDHPLYKDYDHIYEVVEGTYLLSVSSTQSITELYDFQLFPLNDYETVVDMDTPIPVNETSFDLTLEGAYDYVLASVESPSGGMMTLIPDSSAPVQISFYDQNDILHEVHYRITDGPIKIALYPGQTKLLFHYYTAIDVNYEIDIFGETYNESMIITENFTSDYIVNSQYEAALLTFDNPENNYVIFDFEFHPSFAIPSYGYSVQIWQDNSYGNPEILTSFLIDSNQKSVYLEAGTYALRLLGINAYKVKISFEPALDIGTESIDLIATDTLNSKLQYSFEADFQVFNHYPNTQKRLTFSITETSHIFTRAYYGEHYQLLDDQGNRLNLYDRGDFLIELPPGTYDMLFNLNESHSVKKIYAYVLLVNDSIVTEDQHTLNNIDPVTFGVTFDVKFDYRGDSDYVAFVVLEDEDIKISSIPTAYCEIYTIDGTFIRGFSSGGTHSGLKPGQYILKIGHRIFDTTFLGSTYSITVSN